MEKSRIIIVEADIVPVVRDFQPHVVSRIIGRRMTDFQRLTENVNYAVYEDIIVIHNWDDDNHYEYGEYTIRPDGVFVESASGDLIAGIFSRYNNVDLTPYDHYLIVKKEENAIQVYQPRGNDTPVTLDRPQSWSTDSEIQAVCYCSENTHDVSTTLTTDKITFDWNVKVSGDSALYYEITYGLTGIDESEDSVVPLKFKLFQNYPNPFNAQTTINYHVPRSGKVTLKVFNVFGQEIRTLRDEVQKPGKYSVVWDGKDSAGRNVSTGLYMTKLKVGEHIGIKKMLMLK